MFLQSMMPTKLSIPITFKVEIKAKDLREYLLAHERMKPAVFIVTAVHAQYLEFRHPFRSTVIAW